MRTVPFLALAVALGLTAAMGDGARAQDPKGPAPKPVALYGQFRELMVEGKFDIAASFLKAFLDSNPTEADLLEVEKKYGTTAFSGLRAVPKWSDDPKVEKQARENVEEAVKRARAASEKQLYNPARVQKYTRNLGASYEERVFAEIELRRTGDYAIPFMVDEFRVAREKDLYNGILGAIPKLEGQTTAGWIAALDGLAPEQQYGVLMAIAARPDLLVLQSGAQTNLSPVLWRILAQPAGDNPALRAAAEALLNKLHPGLKSATKVPEAELVAIARTFYEHSARYSAAKTNPDGSPTTVPVWVWNAKEPGKLEKVENVPAGQADEYFGLRYARWALERKPHYEPAQGLIVAIAAERAIERARYGNLAKAEPAVYKLLTDAPSTVLNDQLNRGLNQKKTSLVLAMVQVLGDRGDRDAATPPAGTPAKPSLLVKALTYPDPQVQIAAANALLRSPVPVPSEVRGLIVEVLRKAAGADAGAPPNVKGTALIADPNKMRGDATAALLRGPGLGYKVEVFTTGRDLLRRIARASDYDLIMIDQHAVNPVLIDLVGQLRADVTAGNRPTFVVASADKPKPPTFDQLLLRFSALIAATENDVVAMPSPFVPDPRDTIDSIAANRRKIAEQRDGVFSSTSLNRINRLNRVIESTGVTLDANQRLLLNLRLELMSLSVLGAEFPVSLESSPGTVRRIENIRKQIASQPPSAPYGAGLPTTDLLKLMERFEVDLARVPSAMQRFESLYAAVDPVELGLPVETFRDAALEARLARTLRGYPGVHIIPEPFGRGSLVTDLEAAQAAPGQAPRDPAEKTAAQKLAIEWLRKMAIGATPGFDVKSAEPELRSALRVDDLADMAIDALIRFPSADTQHSLVLLALNATRPLATRSKAADAAIRHVQSNGRLTPKAAVDQLVLHAEKEPDIALRGKLLAMKGLLAYNAGNFLNDLKSYSPPLLPPPPPMQPPKDMKDPKVEKEPDPKP